MEVISVEYDENQQEQTKIMHQRLLVAPREQKPGNMSDFRRLLLATFSGMDKLLDVEQLLVDMRDLLKAA